VHEREEQDCYVGNVEVLWGVVMKVPLQHVCNILFYNEVTRYKIAQSMQTFRIPFPLKGLVGKEQCSN
jgi:hypothetical protein